MVNQTILGLDVSTTCIGITIAKCIDGVCDILYINKLKFKIPKKIKGGEALFAKVGQFRENFIDVLQENAITNIVIEEPLVGSNNSLTVATLLKFNGMISQMIYDLTHIVPEYISSYDARKYAFPELLAVRKFNKKGEMYPLNKIQNALKHGEIVLFGEYPWDCEKKYILWNKVANLFPDIQWTLDKKGELQKENFDASDSLVCILGYINKQLYENDVPQVKNVSITTKTIDEQEKKKIEYEVEFCEKNIKKEIWI